MLGDKFVRSKEQRSPYTREWDNLTGDGSKRSTISPSSRTSEAISNTVQVASNAGHEGIYLHEDEAIDGDASTSGGATTLSLSDADEQTQCEIV
jgi:hypothetical protein